MFSLSVTILLVLLYFLPGILAYKNKKANRLAIVVLNLAFGWTVVIWFGCLIWALLKD